MEGNLVVFADRPSRCDGRRNRAFRRTGNPERLFLDEGTFGARRTGNPKRPFSDEGTFGARRTGNPERSFLDENAFGALGTRPVRHDGRRDGSDLRGKGLSSPRTRRPRRRPTRRSSR